MLNVGITTEKSIRKALSDICVVQIDDGVIFDFDHIVPIRADDEYGGYRIGLIARYIGKNTFEG